MSNNMDKIPFSEDLKYWRSESPDEWIMDRFIRRAEAMQAEIESLRAEVARLGGLLSETIPYMRHGIIGGPMCEHLRSSEYPCTCGVDALTEKIPSYPTEKVRHT